MNIISLAHQILDMETRIYELECEVADLREYKAKYNALLDSSLTHSREMVGGIVALAMKPGVLKALSKG